MTQPDNRPLADTARLLLRDLEVHARNERAAREDDRYQPPRLWVRRNKGGAK